VKVVLCGDGGDELWGGYPTYQAHRVGLVYAHVHQRARDVVARLVAKLPVRHGHQPLEWQLKRFALRWDDELVRRHLRWMSCTDLSELARLVPEHSTHAPPILATQVPETHDVLNRLLALDFATYMSGSVLTKVDRASMAWSLEVRPPILDNEMIDWAFQIPSSLKLRGLSSKFLLKRAAAPHLPADILRRRKKGFGIPLARWLRGPLRPLVEESVAGIGASSEGIVDARAARGMMHEHFDMRHDHSKTLWALVVFASWRAAIEKERAASWNEETRCHTM